jgi:hypothetical protein
MINTPGTIFRPPAKIFPFNKIGRAGKRSASRLWLELKNVNGGMRGAFPPDALYARWVREKG